MKRFRWPRLLGGFLYFALVIYLVYGIYQDFVLVAPKSFTSGDDSLVVFGVSLAEQDASTILSQIEADQNEDDWTTSFLLQSQSPIVKVYLDYVAIFDDDNPGQVCLNMLHLAKNDKVPLDVISAVNEDNPMGVLSDSDKEFVFTLKKQKCLDKGGKYFLPHLFLGAITVDAYSDLKVAKINGFRSFDFFPFDEQKIQLDMAMSQGAEDEGNYVIPTVEATISQKGWIGHFESNNDQKLTLHLQRPDFYKAILLLFVIFMLPVILLINNIVHETGSFFEVFFGLLLGLWGTHEILTPKYIDSSVPVDFVIYVLYALVIGEIFIVLFDRFFLHMLKRNIFISKLEPGREGQDEYVEVLNPNPIPIDMTNWLLYDKDGNKFKFPAFVLKGKKFWSGEPGKVTILTKAGTNDRDKLFWGRRGNNVWNASGETAYLEDSTGELISTFSSPSSVISAVQPHQRSRRRRWSRVQQASQSPQSSQPAQSDIPPTDP